MKSKSKEVVVSVQGAAVSKPAREIDSMIQQAIKSKAGVDNLEKLLNLKHEYEKRESEKMFHHAFSEMQGEFPVIPKTKVVKDNGGNQVYRYAALEDIVKAVQPVLRKYRFAYSWSEQLTDKEGYKRIICKISGYGHSESAHVDIPIMGATKMTNSAQQAGSSSTYGKRYSLVGILGIMTDDDDDARGSSEPLPRRSEPEPRRAAPERPTEKPAPVTGRRYGKRENSEMLALVKSLGWEKEDVNQFAVGLFPSAKNMASLPDEHKCQVLDAIRKHAATEGK